MRLSEFKALVSSVCTSATHLGMVHENTDVIIDVEDAEIRRITLVDPTNSVVRQLVIDLDD